MGMYDDVKVQCLKCKKENYVQTKVLGGEMLSVIEKGDDVNWKLSGVFELKGDCEECGERLKILISDGKYIGVTTEESDWIERRFGVIDESLKKQISKKGLPRVVAEHL